MKALQTLLIPTLAIAMIATGCKKEQTNVTPTNNNNPTNPTNPNNPTNPTDPTDPTLLANGSTISGEITANTRLGKGFSYTLAGGVHVKSGATLTIEEGVTIKSSATEPSTAYLLIEPGAKINARGTASAPIVMTSGQTSPKVQDWGGLIICGKATVNTPGGTAASEMGAGVTYGGTDDADNSGILQYVRVEYTGKKQNQTKEHNGITFEGVGSGTLVDHIAVYLGADDGIEFFGGTVSVRYAYVYGASDDCFDWTYGWRGQGQFWVAEQGGDNGDRGFEGDNNGDNNLATPYSEPKIANVTLIGSTSILNEDGGDTRSMKLREGTKGKIYNVVAAGFASGIEVQHDQTLTNMTDGSLEVKGVYLNNDKPWKYSPNSGSWSGATPFESEASNAVNAAGLPSFLNGAIGVETNNAVDVTTLGSWFVAANFKGAVESSNDWTAGWTRK